MRRFRRLRLNSAVREMVRQVRVDKKELILPVFVKEGKNIKEPIKSMPGVFQYSPDKLWEIGEELYMSGICGVLIFGIPSKKDEFGSEAYNENGISQQAVRFFKKNFPSIVTAADVCLCEYTSHGHCGIVKGEEILNDESLKYIQKTAVSLAKAGADIVAPSGMMDMTVKAVRNCLDSEGFVQTPIMSYSAKFASCKYAPFRNAAESSPKFGSRKTYQMDISNSKEALSQIAQDISMGADMVIIKPAVGYLDIIKSASQKFDLPIGGYCVSGEYSMIKAAAQRGWIDEKQMVLENLTCIKRAGANFIITYHALEAAKWLEECL